MAHGQVTVECGYCLRKDEELLAPKILPCNHIHCMQCLSGFFEEKHILVCPAQGCGEVVNSSPDTLPPYDMVGEGNISCDVCMAKKMDIQEAVIYCTVCSNKFCEKHLMSHDEIMYRHKTITIEDYEPQAKNTQTRNCAKHEDLPYFMGCKLCLNLVCKKCLPDLDRCDNGASHSLLSLEDLVSPSMKKDISAEMMAKEEQYEKLFKEMSKRKADYDNETTEMVELIHKTRDAQEEALKPKYKILEEELMEKRQKSCVAMSEFMEDIVLRKWTQLGNHRKMMDTRMKCSHQVDIVKGLKAFKEEMQKLPRLKLTDEVKLKKLATNGSVELEIVSSCDIVIGFEFPQAMTLLKSVPLPAGPISVCHYSGSTYVGLSNGTVTRIDNNYKLHNSFISNSSAIESISVYKDRFYTLSYASRRVVNVYDMSGGHIRSWRYPCHSDYISNMLTVVADQVVIADPRNMRLVIYSLTGEYLRDICYRQLMSASTTLCAVDNASVVVSNLHTSKVFRVNMDTEEILWTISDVTQPQGLVCYGSYILVATYGNKTIYILNTTSGEIVHKILDDAIDGQVYGLEVYGTTLVVPLRSSNKVLFYQLVY